MASAPSVYAVAVKNTADVIAAVNFARKNNLRLVVKGGGHSYQGTSNAADSLLIWTRAMHNITLHDAFVAQGCSGSQAPHPAVTAEAGASHFWAEQHASGQYGVPGAPDEALAAARDTAMNPAVLDAFALAIVAGGGPPAYPGLPGHVPDLAVARKDAGAIDKFLRNLNESSSFEG
jgi:FAD binding domain